MIYYEIVIGLLLRNKYNARRVVNCTDIRLITCVNKGYVLLRVQPIIPSNSGFQCLSTRET